MLDPSSTGGLGGSPAAAQSMSAGAGAALWAQLSDPKVAKVVGKGIGQGPA